MPKMKKTNNIYATGARGARSKHTLYNKNNNEKWTETVNLVTELYTAKTIKKKIIKENAINPNA